MAAITSNGSTATQVHEELALPDEMPHAPLDGIIVIDMTEVQSGPSCTQMLAWFGAEVIKIERPGGDPTRAELRDLPGEDSLYYLQLNSNKRSVALDVKTPDGKKILTELLEGADMFVENLHPGAIDELGFGWQQVHAINPRLVMGSIKGFNPRSRFEYVKCFDPVAQCMSGAAAATGWNEGDHDIPTMSGAALGDSNSGMHLLAGLLAGLIQRDKTGTGCYVYQSMQNASMNLCRMKLHDQLLLDATGELPEYPNYPYQDQGTTVPRQENAEGGGELGWLYRCKGWETDPSSYVYIVIQRAQKGFEEFCHAIGLDRWIDDPDFSTPLARFQHKREVYAAVEKYTISRTKMEVTEDLGKKGVPCGPVLDWEEIEHDEELRRAKAIVEVREGGARGSFLTIGCPTYFSNFVPKIERAPYLGEGNAEILGRLGYTREDLEKLEAEGTVQAPARAAFEGKSS